MGALATAFELSEGNWTDRFDRITVYQRGWRLGGKGASSRGRNGRIEEHGLHVLLGYYDHTFDVMRRCYEALDRGRTDPSCPIRTWDDAVAPSNLVGVMDRHDGAWEPWVATFSPFAGRPGGGAEGPTGSSPLAVADLVVRSLRLLVDFFASLPFPTRRERLHRVQHLAHRPRPPAPRHPSRRWLRPSRARALIGLTLPLNWSERVVQQATVRGPATGPGARLAVARRAGPAQAPRTRLRAHPAARRSYELVELVTANLVGIMVDGLLTKPRRLQGHQPPRLPRVAARARHRPRCAGVTDPPGHVRPRLRLRGGRSRPPALQRRARPGAGDQDAPRVLRCTFWKMQAGMGEVIFAPSLRGSARPGCGVPFLPPGRRAPAERRRALDRRHRAGGAGRPRRGGPRLRSPDPGQGPSVLARHTARARSCGPPSRLTGSTSSRSGHPDVTSVAAPWKRARTSTSWCSPSHSAWCRYVCGELVDASPAWRSMVDNVGTVATQALQLWLSEDERALGWSGPAGVTVSGFVKPFDTWASMSHLLPVEDWPGGPAADDRLLLRCPGHAGRSGTARRTPRARTAPCRAGPRHSWTATSRHCGRPPSTDGGFRWPLLCDGTPRPTNGPNSSTASTGGPTSTLPTATCSPCPAPTSTACSRGAPASPTWCRRRLDGQRPERRMRGGCHPFRAAGRRRRCVSNWREASGRLTR